MNKELINNIYFKLNELSSLISDLEVENVGFQITPFPQYKNKSEDVNMELKKDIEDFNGYVKEVINTLDRDKKFYLNVLGDRLIQEGKSLKAGSMLPIEKFVHTIGDRIEYIKNK